MLAPRKSSSGFRTFLAVDCQQTGKQNLDEGEGEIQILEVSADEYWQMVESGEICAIETITAGFMSVLSGKFPFPVV